MTLKFNFASIFGRFGTSFTVRREIPGHYDYEQGGKHVSGGFTDPETVSGIVVPFSFEELQFETTGTYTRKDRKIYVKIPAELQINDLVTYRDVTYRITESKDHTLYGDFNVYLAKQEGGGPDAGS